MKHILIVDDEADIRAILQQFLGHAGYRVTAAPSVFEALRVLKADPPQLLISDLQLEDSDGFALIEELKAVMPDTPVILLTGVLFDPQVIQETFGGRISCYLPKTSPLTRILAEVKQLLPTGS
jgi:DNA-binding NtrC family response regulator